MIAPRGRRSNPGGRNAPIKFRISPSARSSRPIACRARTCEGGSGASARSRTWSWDSAAKMSWTGPSCMSSTMRWSSRSLVASRRREAAARTSASRRFTATPSSKRPAPGTGLDCACRLCSNWVPMAFPVEPRGVVRACQRDLYLHLDRRPALVADVEPRHRDYEHPWCENCEGEQHRGKLHGARGSGRRVEQGGVLMREQHDHRLARLDARGLVGARQSFQHALGEVVIDRVVERAGEGADLGTEGLADAVPVRDALGTLVRGRGAGRHAAPHLEARGVAVQRLGGAGAVAYRGRGVPQRRDEVESEDEGDDEGRRADDDRDAWPDERVVLHRDRERGTRHREARLRSGHDASLVSASERRTRRYPVRPEVSNPDRGGLSLDAAAESPNM